MRSIKCDASLHIIYISGSSYSGSTALGLVLGSSHKVFNGGEVCKYQEIKKGTFKIDPNHEVTNECTCGQLYSECPYWSRVFKQYQKDVDFNPAGFSKENLKLMIRLLNPFGSLKARHSKVEDYYEYSGLLFREAKKRKPTVEYLLDISKSIYNVYLLKDHPDVKLHVIHLIRNPMDTCNSFKKHQVGTLYAITSWVLVNLFTKILVRRSRLKCLTIKYDDLCSKTEETFESIRRFLGIELNTKEYVNKVNSEDYHIVAGNPFLNNFSFDGLANRKSKSRLNPFEKVLVKMAHVLFPYSGHL